MSQFSETCLIIDDRPKSNLTKSDAQKKIQSENIPISKVLKLSKLASDYRAFEAKRKLCNSYDMFLADKRVVPLLPRLLGKQFFKKRKVPVPLDLKKKNWKEQVEKACSSGLLNIRTGTCSVVRVAKLSMERDEIVDNVVAAIDGVVEIVPKKWGNVRSFHVKFLESLALPVYQAVPDMKLKIEGGKGEEEDEKVEEDGKKGEEKGGGIHDRKVVKKKKGRIHQVRYMDDKVGEDLVEDKSDGDDEVDAVVDDDSEKSDQEGSGELVNKKRKKGIKVEKGYLSELSSVKKKSKKSSKESGKQKKEEGNENLITQRKNKLSVEDEESGKKEKKNKSVDVKVKAKKSKKAA